MNKIKLIALLYLISPLSLAEEISLKTKDSNLHEHYSQEVPVSGNVIAGIELYSENNPEQSFSSTIHLPQNIQEENNYLCFQLLSKDGTYTSQNIYLIPKTTNSPTQKEKTQFSADFSPSEHLDFLNEKSNNNAIATKISIGECQKSTEETYLPALKASTSNSTHLRIYIDSLGATDVKMAARNQINKSQRNMATCQPAKGSRLTGFDYTCTLPITTPLNGSIWDLFIARFKYTRKLDTVKIQVVL